MYRVLAGHAARLAHARVNNYAAGKKQRWLNLIRSPREPVTFHSRKESSVSPQLHWRLLRLWKCFMYSKHFRLELGANSLNLNRTMLHTFNYMQLTKAVGMFLNQNLTKWLSDIRPSMVTHTRNLCSAINPSKVHTHTVNTHLKQCNHTSWFPHVRYIKTKLYSRSECARMHSWHLNAAKQSQFRERNEGY